jgi:AmiR/NasT family two-component response regulator
VDLLRQLMQAGKPVRCPIVMISTEFEARGSEIKALNVLAWIVKPIHRARLYNLVLQIFDAS